MKGLLNAIKSYRKEKAAKQELMEAVEKIGRFYTAPSEKLEADVFITEKISYDSLPNVVKELFPRQKRDKITEVSVIVEPSGLKTYIVMKEEIMREERVSGTARVFDFFRDEKVGDASFEYQEPFVKGDRNNIFGVINQRKTEKGFEKRGLGERRLIILDQFCQRSWGIPVNSSGPSPSAEATWKKLVRRRLAVFDKDQGAYRFIRHGDI